MYEAVPFSFISGSGNRSAALFRKGRRCGFAAIVMPATLVRSPRLMDVLRYKLGPRPDSHRQSNPRHHPFGAFPGDRFPRVRPSRRHHRAHSGTGDRGLPGGAAPGCRTDRRPAKIGDRCNAAIGRPILETSCSRTPRKPETHHSFGHEILGRSRRPKEGTSRSSSRRRRCVAWPSPFAHAMMMPSRSKCSMLPTG